MALDEQASPRTTSDFGQLARRMGAWTTNLLASGIVLVAGLAMGWQVLTWWRADESAKLAAQQLQDLPIPVPAGEGREFWTKRGPLKVERVRGGDAEVLAAMRAFCRNTGPLVSVGEKGPGETRFVEKLREQTPLEVAGGMKVYQPLGQTGMVVGVDQASERIAAWSFALPAEEGMWLVYHFRPMAGNSVGSIVSKP